MIFGNICSYFPQKVGFDISYKLSIKKTNYMKCQSLFSGKDNRNINLPSAEFAKRMVKAYFSALWSKSADDNLEVDLIFSENIP